jgi:2-deoxy-D-gluconate 3-dehydrogenase
MSILSQFSLAGKTALVTGCKRGIGKSIAVALAEAGADIIGVSASLELSGSKVQQEVEATGRTFKAYQADFEDRKAIYTFIEKAKAECKPVDILFCNAGTIKRKPAAEHPDDFWDTVIKVNLDAQFILAREFGKDMIAKGNGKVIFTASLLSFQGGITVPGYAASKGAIKTLTMALSNEWSGKGVQVNAIAPGYIATDNTEALRNDPDRSQAILARIPAGRWGTGEDMQGAAVYLASPASNYVSGTIITVDGGWMGR